MTRLAIPPGPAWLFVPGDRPDRWAKAAAAADAVIIDLEDAVGVNHKESARRALLDVAAHVRTDRLIVRINGGGGPWHDADVEIVAATDIRTVLVPKVRSAEDLEVLGERLPGRGLIALCENASAVLEAPRIAAVQACVGLFLGSEDLAADIGAIASRDGGQRQHPFIDHARTTIRLAAAACGIAAIDTPTVLVDRSELVSEEARVAAAMGFHAKACIHPTQVPLVRKAFAPDERDVAWARRVLAGVNAARRQDAMQTVFVVDGQMVDGPVVALAQSILRNVRLGEKQ